MNVLTAELMSSSAQQGLKAEEAADEKLSKYTTLIQRLTYSEQFISS